MNKRARLLSARLILIRMPESSEKDPRVYLAAERTLLAWIRTGLAMMGFGFVVARFGLFLREMQAVQQGTPVESARGSLWFGIALVLMGVLVNISAVFHHMRLVRVFRQGTWDADRPSRPGIIAAAMLAIAGLAVAIYLLTVR
jgi:putative membrane protein